MTVLATGTILAGIAVGPAFGESASASGTAPTNAGGTLLGATAVVKAPKPVQALETWTDAGLRTLNIAYKAPTTGPATYLVEVVNVTTNKAIWSKTTTDTYTGDAPLTTDLPASGNLVLRVTASNTAGSSTAARALIDGKVGPINMMKAAWFGSGTAQVLQMTWNAPNYSNHGRVTKTEIYGANGNLLTTVTGNSVTLTQAQSANVKGTIKVRPIAADGTAGAYYTKIVGLPNKAESVTITDGPAVASARTDYTVNAATTGYADGSAAKLLVESNNVWNEVAASTVTQSNVAFKTQFTGNGPQNYKVIINDGATEQVSESRRVEVYDPSVAATPSVVAVGDDRYLQVNAVTSNVPEGTVATIAVKAPGQGTFTDMGSAKVGSDGKIAYTSTNPEQYIPAAGGTYTTRIVLAPLADGLAPYTSPEVGLAIPTIDRTVTMSTKSILGFGDSGRYLQLGGKAAGRVIGTSVVLTMVDPSGKTIDLGTAKTTDATGTYTLTTAAGVLPALGRYTVTATAGTGASATSVSDTVTIASQALTSRTNNANGAQYIGAGLKSPSSNPVKYEFYYRLVGAASYTKDSLVANRTYAQGADIYFMSSLPTPPGTYEVMVVGTSTTGPTTQWISNVPTGTIKDLGTRKITGTYHVNSVTSGTTTTNYVSADGVAKGYPGASPVYLWVKAPGATTFTKAAYAFTDGLGNFSFDQMPNSAKITTPGKAWQVYVSAGSIEGYQTQSGMDFFTP